MIMCSSTCNYSHWTGASWHLASIAVTDKGTGDVAEGHASVAASAAWQVCARLNDCS